MAHLVFFDIGVKECCIITGSLEVSPEGDPVLIVGDHLLGVRVDQLLLHGMLSGVLGHLLVLLEPVAGPQLEGLDVLRTNHHTVVYAWILLKSLLSF